MSEKQFKLTLYQKFKKWLIEREYIRLSCDDWEKLYSDEEKDQHRKIDVKEMKDNEEDDDIQYESQINSMQSQIDAIDNMGKFPSLNINMKRNINEKEIKEQIHLREYISCEDCYELRIGKFGAFFYDTINNKPLELTNILTLLNSVKTLKNHILEIIVANDLGTPQDVCDEICKVKNKYHIDQGQWNPHNLKLEVD